MYQSLANGFISASWIALVALGFGLIYGPTRFFHFAHGVVFVLAPYMVYCFLVLCSLPIGLAIPLAILCSVLAGCLMEIGIYKPLRGKGATQLTLLLASLGLYVAGQNAISLAFGKDTKTLGLGVRQGIEVLNARVTIIQFVVLAVSAFSIVVLGVALKKTRWGKSLRAVANDRLLAEVSGIDSKKAILWSFAVGSALAAIAGILVALDVDMTPTMGLNALILGVVAFIVGGTGSIPGIALGALLVGMAQHVGALALGSKWQDAIVFVILVLFLVAKPGGFFGRIGRRASV